MGTKTLLRRHGRLSLLAALAALPSLAAPPPSATINPVAKPLGCLIEPDRVADVGSQVIGLVERLHAERGDRVAAGAPLVSLRADVERANLGVASARERIEADALAAQAALELAQQKLRRAEALVAQQFVSVQAVELARGEHELAQQKLNQARSQQQIWAEERQLAQAQLALRTVRSPISGVVVDRYVNTGERVEDRPVMRVAVIHPLRVELMVPTALYGQFRVGETITVRPELPGAAPVQAQIRQVDRVLDAASNSFRVRLSLPNPDHRLPAGLRCKADLPGAPAAGTAAAGAPRQQP